MNKTIDSIAKGIAQLLSPYAEVVLHDIPTDTIVEIYHPISERKKGDPSLLDEDLLLEDGKKVYGPYKKLNSDGSFCKSVSIVLDEVRGKPKHLLCINLHLGALEKVQHALQAFVNSTVEQPKALFHFDWREKIHEHISDYTSKTGYSTTTLPSHERRKLVRLLEQKKAFGAPNSHKYIAQILGVSRATIFNDLKEA